MAPAHHTAAVALGEAEVGGTLVDEEDHSITTTGTGIMIPEIVHQTARTDRVVDRPCAEIATCETSEILTEETVTTADFLGNTILT